MANLSALPQQHTWSGLVDRDDVVWDRGMLHLVHDDVTPEQARIDDLLLVADALGSAGVPVLLIRHDRVIPALVADLADSATALAALADVGAREPLYLKARRRPPELAAEAAVLPAAPTALRVYRPRIVRDGTLRYGSALAARLEFWRFGEELVEAPDDNALMRRTTPAQDLDYTEVERYGRTWRTISGMFDVQPDEFTHDVDLVFSWVDGSSTDFQRARAAQLAEYVVGEGDEGPARYRHVDELRFALRSVHMYAPWVRRIFIATDSPVPSWLGEHPKVTVVRSEEFFADPTVLPTHNSHAVEAQLHHIPGLSEHFIYSNDDMFFGRLVEPELFFSAAGVSRFVECEVRIGAGAPTPARSGHDNGLRVNRALLRSRFGRTILRDLEHCATPLRRSVMAELEMAFADDFARTAASRFRSATDVSVTNSLYHHYALMTGRAVTTTRPRVRYVQTTLIDSPRRMERLANRTDIDMFCLNDGGSAQIPEEVRVSALSAALEKMFPVRPPWERDEISEGRRSAL
ncbi:stealth conserved region 3 domain-containing protein [Microbacterium deminutum]|uniref:Stealth family protein n=1 Tax=Microbacterium deminutum TaxID=344164 RepID=A0ABP5CSH4_9MICO